MVILRYSCGRSQTAQRTGSYRAVSCLCLPGSRPVSGTHTRNRFFPIKVLCADSVVDLLSSVAGDEFHLRSLYIALWLDEWFSAMPHVSTHSTDGAAERVVYAAVGSTYVRIQLMCMPSVRVTWCVVIMPFMRSSIRHIN